MPKFNSYPAATDISDTDILLKDTSGGTATKKVTARQMADYALAKGRDNFIYPGVDLTVKFASEITAAGNDPWAWIKARITAGNFTGIHVGDYIPFKATNSAQTQLYARILGINTYKNYGSTAVGNHIDFWAGLWPTKKPINPANYNNGTSVSDHPWLASDAYLYANSLSGQVPSTATANPTLAAKDYTSDGIYYYLPTALKSVIVEKHFLLPKRYTAGSLLTDDNNFGWASIGKIWFPTEVEVYGAPMWGGKGGYSNGGSVQYSFFANGMNRLVFGRTNWWLLSACAGYSSAWCSVGGVGYAANSLASYTSVAAPVCFRIS